ncbi:NAD(P)-binding protein [Sodiomyces alkalinus F11]|uniref:NAD(P)-binding protein n=1 Tax=Sodiomyces alkalinus (strain CBS 110278 / VKM F-3762 / F11) TaxID=1314773 RepID=A0A3N2Q896_SODAK|nr:NAD(P)-binding protein [Sodiomyces alkalinus F11]ROT42982.1 NAD(P)-binding protein [Sodiomyces alkalinus F11]
MADQQNDSGNALLQAATLTKTYHRESYPGISPTRPEVSQAGRTVLIGGGSMGIGFSAAQSFAAAGAARVIIVARRKDRVDAAVARLKSEYPDAEVLGRPSDMTDSAQVASLWDGFAADGVVVDVLLLSTAVQSLPHTILGKGTEEVWNHFNINVKAGLAFTERFYKQPGRDASKKLWLINLSTAVVHAPEFAGRWPTYAVTKAAGLMLAQLIAHNHPVSDMQVVSFHPGVFYTEIGQQTGQGEDAFEWDDIKLPGDFAVWTASEEAAFLHGRFVWAHWDVEELKAGPIRERSEADSNFLTVGIHGL